MADSIKIKIDAGKYQPPKQEDILAAKKFILQREEYARLLQGRVDNILSDAAGRIVAICYRYDFDPLKLYLGFGFNEQMMEEISEVMDEIELEILDMMYEYSTRVTNDKDHINALLLWLATLGRGNRNLADTLHGYLYKFMKDMEAVVAALKFSNVPVSEAITKAKTFLHSVYTMPEMLRAFRFAERFAATYIRSRGIERGAVGISNNGSTNVVNMAKTTLQMAFMREYRNEMEEDGAAGYYVLRGSDYPCDLCDSKVGFHPISDKENFPPYHPHCCCIAIPINFQKQ